MGTAVTTTVARWQDLQDRTDEYLLGCRLAEHRSDHVVLVVALATAACVGDENEHLRDCAVRLLRKVADRLEETGPDVLIRDAVQVPA